MPIDFIPCADAAALQAVIAPWLANPTSNRLYARIGFQPVLDQRWVRWTSGDHP